MSIRDDFFAAKAKGSLWDVAVSIKRGNPLPLDADSIFESYAALEAYAVDVLAYPGQVVAVVNTDSTGIYYLDQNLAIQPVGVIPTGDEKTIEVTANGVISILGASSAEGLTLPRMKEDKSGIEWVPVAQIVQGDGNDNTTYEFTVLEDKVGFKIVTKFNGTQIGDAVEYVLDAYTKSEADAITDALDERIEALEAKEDKDTTYTVAANDKVLKLTGTELSSTISLKHENGMISLTGIDGEVIAEFSDAEFIADGVLEDVSYNADSKELTFTWNIETEEGKKKTDVVNIADLIDTYTAGDGLSLENAKFSVKIDEASEFLSVGEAGVKVSGVSDAIDAAKQAAIEAAASDADAKADAAKQAAIDDAAEKYATKTYVGTIPTAEEGKEQANTIIDYINIKAQEVLDSATGGSSESAASVKQQLDTYKNANDPKVNALLKEVWGVESLEGLDYATTSRIDALENVGAQANVIEVVKVNGTALNPDGDKAVDITVPTAISQLSDWSTVNDRITEAKAQADKGVTDAGAAGAAAAVNAEEIGKHANRIGVLETANGDHEARIIALEGADTKHAAEYTALKGIVDGHTSEIAGKADSSTLEAVSARVSVNEQAIKTLNEVTIPGINQAIGNKADASALANYYTKTEIDNITGTPAEGKTLVDMIADAKSEATYDDTEVRGLINANAAAIAAIYTPASEGIAASGVLATEIARVEGLVAAEKSRAEGIEADHASRIETMEAFWEAAQADGTDTNVIDTLKEIQEYIASDESGASAMAASIKANEDAIKAINNESTGILAQAKTYTDTEIAKLTNADTGILAQAKAYSDANLATAKSYTDTSIAAIFTNNKASNEAFGVVKGNVKGVNIETGEIKSISVDLLVNGDNELILNGGSAV